MPMRFLQATSCWMMKGTWLSQIKDGIVEWRRCIVCYAVWWGLNSQVDSTLIPAALGVIKKHPGLPTFTCCRESQRRCSTWTLVSCCVAHLAGRWNYWNLQLLFDLFRLACMFWYVLLLKSCESLRIQCFQNILPDLLVVIKSCVQAMQHIGGFEHSAGFKLTNEHGKLRTSEANDRKGEKPARSRNPAKPCWRCCIHIW